MKLSRWLKDRGLPPPILPMVCGYAPLASNILGVIKIRWEAEQAVLEAERKKTSETGRVGTGFGKRDRSNDRDKGDGAPVDLDSPDRPPKNILPEIRVPPEPPVPPKVTERATSSEDGENILDKEGGEAEEVAKKEEEEIRRENSGDASSTVVIMPRKVDRGKWHDGEGDDVQEEEDQGESGVGGGEADSDTKGGIDGGLGQAADPNPNRISVDGGVQDDGERGEMEGGGMETAVDEPKR